MLRTGFRCALKRPFFLISCPSTRTVIDCCASVLLGSLLCIQACRKVCTMIRDNTWIRSTSQSPPRSIPMTNKVTLSSTTKLAVSNQRPVGAESTILSFASSTYKGLSPDCALYTRVSEVHPPLFKSGSWFVVVYICVCSHEWKRKGVGSQGMSKSMHPSIMACHCTKKV